MRFHDIQLTGNLLVTGSLTLPAGTTAERPTNPRSGSVRLNTTLGVMEIYTAALGSEWVTVGEQATTSLDTLRDIEYLLVAGGAAGGGSQSWGAGGGGAGGYLSSSLASVTSGSTFNVTIGGGGGAVTNAVGTSGTNSSIAGATISTITATGGGGGGGQNSSKTDGASGGSGGGAQGAEIYATPGSGTVGQGNDGGPGADGQSLYTAGGGGGGATGVGQDASVHSDKSGGNGGTGATSNITGTSVERAGGGGGGTNNGSGGSGTGGTATGGGGTGGTGFGSTNGADGTAGTANTGGGGGGAGHGTGAAGGSGVAIFAYGSGSFNCVGGIVGDAGNGRKYHKFNSSGTFLVGSSTDFQIVTDGLVLHWDVNDYRSYPGSGTTIYDISNSGTTYNGTFANSITYTQDGGTAVLGTNGSNSYIYNSSVSFATSNHSIVVGSRFNTLTDGRLLNAHNNNWLLGHWSGGTDNYFAGDWITTVQDSNGSDQDWHIYGCTGDYSGDTYKFYVNGTNTVSNSNGNRGPDGLNFGAYGGGASEFGAGYMSFVLAYNRVLTDAEMVQNYNALKHRLGLT